MRRHRYYFPHGLSVHSDLTSKRSTCPCIKMCSSKETHLSEAENSARLRQSWEAKEESVTRVVQVMKKKQREIEKKKAKEKCPQYTKCTKRQIKDDYEDMQRFCALISELSELDQFTM